MLEDSADSLGIMLSLTISWQTTEEDTVTA